MTYSGRLGDRHTGLSAISLAPIKHFPRFLFQLYFNKKYVEVGINAFTMHLIISKWLRKQKCRQKRKTLRQEEVEAKEETVYESVFIILKLVSATF